MNLEDIKVRKQWLIMVVLMTVMTIVHQLIAFKYEPGLNGGPKYTILIVNCTLMVAFMYWFYVCAYQKFGTKFLTFFLIVSPISLVGSVIVYWLNIIPFKNFFPFYWVLTVASFVMGVIMFVLNWKMRKINLRMRRLHETVIKS